MMRKKRNGGSTSNALLGLLTLCPMSGYDIKAMIPESIGHFWSESYGQIYPSLKGMEAAGLVEKKTERKKGKPDRNVYLLTREGRKELRQWLRLPVVSEVPRNELLLKLFFGRQVPTSVSTEHVQAQREKHGALLTRYEAVEKALKREHRGNPDLPYWLMTLSMGKHTSRAMLRWCEETLEQLEKLAK